MTVAWLLIIASLVALDVDRVIVEAHIRKLRWHRARLEAHRIMLNWINRGIWQPGLYDR